MGKKILLVGTLDSKGREMGYLRQRVEERGGGVIILDAGTLGNQEGSGTLLPWRTGWGVSYRGRDRDCHISDPRFVQQAVEWLDEMIHAPKCER
jgi:hypothetical protein